MTEWIFFAAFCLFLIWPVCIYNRLVLLRNEVRNAWHQIDVQLKRRHDLIPNLVAVVKGFMEFEKDTLEKVVAARAKALTATTFHERASAETRVTHALGGLFAVIENYPSLKSNESVLDLQEELVSTENRIAFARQLYNDLVANFRTRLEVFPDRLVASFFSFQAAEYFAAAEDDRSLPPTDISDHSGGKK